MRELQVGDFLCKVGETAQENWDLIDQARKGHWFFHLTDFPSPYVVLECDRDEPNVHLKERCAQICVENSKQRHNKKVKVDSMPCNNVRISRKDAVGECDYKNEGKVEIIVVEGGKKKGGGDVDEAAPADGEASNATTPQKGRGRGRGRGAAAASGTAAATSSGEVVQGDRVAVRKSPNGGWATVTLESQALRDALLRSAQEIVAHGGVSVKLQPQVDPKTKVESPTEIFASWGRKAEEKSPLSEAELLRCFEALAKRTAASLERAAPAKAAGVDLEVRKAAVGGCAVVTFADASVRDAVLSLGAEVTLDSGVLVKLRPQCDPKTKEEVPTALFAAWGRKVEEASPVAEAELLRCFERLRDQASPSAALGEGAPAGATAAAAKGSDGEEAAAAGE